MFSVNVTNITGMASNLAAAASARMETVMAESVAPFIAPYAAEAAPYLERAQELASEVANATMPVAVEAVATVAVCAAVGALVVGRRAGGDQARLRDGGRLRTGGRLRRCKKSTEGGLFVQVTGNGPNIRLSTIHPRQLLAGQRIRGCIHHVGGSEKAATLTEARMRSICKLHTASNATGRYGQGKCVHHVRDWKKLAAERGGLAGRAPQ